MLFNLRYHSNDARYSISTMVADAYVYMCLLYVYNKLLYLYMIASRLTGNCELSVFTVISPPRYGPLKRSKMAQDAARGS